MSTIKTLFCTGWLLMVILSTGDAYGQVVTIEKKIQLSARADNFYLHSNQRNLYVAENGVLNLYNAVNGTKVRSIDTFPFKHFPLLSGGLYARQAGDSLGLLDLETGTYKIMPFKEFPIFAMAWDPASQLLALSNLQGKLNISLIDKSNQVRMLAPSDTNSHYIKRIGLSPGGKLLAVQTLDANFMRYKTLVYETHDLRLLGTLTADYAADFLFGKNGLDVWIRDGWGSVYSMRADTDLQDNDEMFSEEHNSYSDGIESIDVFHVFDTAHNLLTISENGIAAFWDRMSHAKTNAIPLSIGRPEHLQVLAGEQAAVVSCRDSTISVLKIDNVMRTDSEPDIDLVLQRPHSSRIDKIVNDITNDHLYTNDDNGLGSQDLKVWDRYSLRQLKTIEHFYMVGLTADNRYIIGSSSIIDAATLENVTPLYFKKKYFTDIVDYNPSMRRLLVYDRDTLKEIDFASGLPLKTVLSCKQYLKNEKAKYGGNVSDWAIHPKKSIIAAAVNYSGGVCGSWQIVVCSRDDGRQLQLLPGLDRDNECLRAVEFNPVLPYLLSRTSGQVILWNYETGKKEKEIIEKIEGTDVTEDIYATCFSGNGKYLLLGYVTGRVSLWDMHTLTKIKDIRFGKWKIINSLSFLDERSVIAASESHLFIIDIQKGLEITSFGTQQQIEKIEKLLIDEKKDVLYSLQDNRLAAWNFRSLLNFKKADFSQQLPTYLKNINFNADSSAIICTDLFTNPNMYDLASDTAYKGKELFTPDGNELQGRNSIQTCSGLTILVAEHYLNKLHTLLFFDRDGKLLRNMWDTLRFYTDSRSTLLLNPAEDSVYLPVRFKKNTRENLLIAVCLKDHATRGVYASERTIEYCTFLPNQVLLVIDGKFNLVDIAARKLLFTSAFDTGDYYQYDSISRRLFVASRHDIAVWHVPDLKLQTPLYCTNSFSTGESVTSSMAFAPGRNALFAGFEDGSIKVYDGGNFQNRLSVYTIDSGNYIIKNSKGYYYSTRQSAPDFIAYSYKNHSYPFAQFDGYLNRPDKLAEDLWITDRIERSTLDAIYKKRLEFKKVLAQPASGEAIASLTIDNRFSIPSVVYDSSLQFKVKLDGSGFEELNVSDNGNQLPSLSLKQTKSDATFSVTVALNAGMNHIKLYARKKDSTISAITELKITYNPPTPVAGTTYFIGIGVNHYDNKPELTLSYAVKDMEDLGKLVKEKAPRTFCRAIAEKEATRENILQIKDILKNTGIEDIVIIAFSGHGLLDRKNNNFYFGTHDVNFDNPSERGLSYEDIIGLFDHIRARKKLLLIDACHSGETERPDAIKAKSMDELIKAGKQKAGIGINNSSKTNKTDFELMQSLFNDLSETNGIVAISASQGYGTAEENSTLDNGTFTSAILGCLTGHSSLPNLKNHLSGKSSGITVGQLKDFVVRQVPLLTKNRQLPTSRSENREYDWTIW